VQRLLDAGVQADDISASLGLAAFGRHLCVVVLLCHAAGVDVNYVSPDSFLTALEYAVAAGDASIVEVLLSSGASVDVPSSRNTPLVTAASLGHVEVAQLLLSAGADVTKKSSSGTTALMEAVMHGHEGVVRLLQAAEAGGLPGGAVP
jgi:ankyrin repeat protein